MPHVGFSGNVDDFVRYWFENDANVSNEVLQIAKRLGAKSQVELYIATGQEHYRAAYLWDVLGFSDYFQKIFYSADIGYLKDDIRFFRSISERLSISETENPLFFDDQEDVVDIARTAGWDAVVVNTPEDIRSHPRISELLYEQGPRYD